MLKVNSGVLRDAEDALLAQSRTVANIGERAESVRRALSWEGDTFLREACAVAAARDALADQAAQLRALERLLDGLLTYYVRCERELSAPLLQSPGAQAAAQSGTIPAAGAYISPDELRNAFHDWIEPLIDI